MKRVMKGKPAFCPQWPKARRDAFLAETGEDPVAAEKESKQG
jgi:hypothetical protein